jgi:hypothetical protein
MSSTNRRGLPAMLVGALLVSLSLQGCIATAVAGTAVSVAAKVTTFAVSVPFKVAGAALHVGRHTAKKPTASR